MRLPAHVGAAMVTACGVLALAGCAHVGRGSDAAPGPAANPAGEERPVLRRPPGRWRYRLQVESDEGRGPQTLVAEFEVETSPGRPESVTLDTVARGPRGAEPRSVPVSPEARRTFGGDAGGAGPIGRFDLGDGATAAALVPQEVPEPVFGAVLDFVAFLTVQSPEFGTDSLRRAGDEHAFGSFAESWTRPPALVAARIECPGGRTRLASLSSDEAVLEWRPDPMPLALLRRSGTAEGAPRLLLAGHEHLVLEVRVDPRTGALLGGRSLRDDLEMRVHANSPHESLPPWSPDLLSGGLGVTIRRSLVLTRLPPAP